MFTLSIDRYEKGMVGNSAIVMDVVETFSMKSLHFRILVRHHWFYWYPISFSSKIGDIFYFGQVKIWLVHKMSMQIEDIGEVYC